MGSPDDRNQARELSQGLGIVSDFHGSEKMYLDDPRGFIDKDIAKYYYEANLYYEAFENEFNRQVKPILNKINSK